MDDKYLYTYTLHYPVLTAKGVSSTAKLLYSIIWPLTTKKGYAWPSNEYLAKPLGITIEGVRRCMRKLEEKGLIVTQITHEGGKTVRKIWCTLPREEAPTEVVVGPKTAPTFVSDRPQQKLEATPTEVVYHIKDEHKERMEQEEVNTPKPDEDQIEVSDGYVLAKALLTLIRRNKKYYSKIATHFSPEKEEASLCRWAKYFDLLLTRDAKEYDEVVSVLKWCQKDEFWQGQILSGNKFRKQYETLRLGMGGVATGAKSADQAVTDELIKAYGYLCNNKAWKPRRGQMPKFLEATDRVIAFIDMHSDRGLTPVELIKYLRDCLQEAFREKGEIVHPGHLNSDYTWDVLLPQFLENVIGAL